MGDHQGAEFRDLLDRYLGIADKRHVSGRSADVEGADATSLERGGDVARPEDPSAGTGIVRIVARVLATRLVEPSVLTTNNGRVSP